MSGLFGDIAVGARIARAELRDLLRRNDSRRQRAALGLVALLVVPLWLTVVRQGYAAGVQSRDGTTVAVVAVARNLLVPGLLVVVLFGGLSAAQSLARNAVRPLVLTTASTRAVVVGKLLYLLSTWLLVLVFAAGPVAAYAAGARAPVFPLALAVGGVPLLLLTMSGGLSLAYLLWLAVERLGLPEMARRLVTASFSVVGFLFAFGLGLALGQTTGDGGVSLPTGDPVVPLGWYADLLFVGSPVAEPLGVRTWLAAVAVWGAVPLAFAALLRLAPAYWYATTADGAATGDGEDTAVESTPSERIGRGAGLVGRSRLLRVALRYARNVARRPDQYVYLFYYLFPVASVVTPVAANEPSATPAALGAGLVLLGVWLAGGVVGLNPLGSEGAMLSQVVLAPTPDRTFVHARLLVGVALGGLLSLVGVLLVVAWAVGLPALSAVTLWGGLLVVGGVGATLVTSASFALGIGSVLPKFETTEVFDSLETLAPSVFAAVIHGLLSLAVLSGVAVVAAALAPGNPLGVSRWTAVATGLALVFGLVALADGSRRYAIARLHGYGRGHLRLGRPFAVYAATGLAVLSLLLGQTVSLAAVGLLGIDLPAAVLLPVLFILEYVGVAVVAVGFLYVSHRGLDYVDLRWPSTRELGAVAVGLAATLLVWAASATLVEGLGLPSAEHALFDPGEGDPRLLLLLVPLVVLVNGPLEELLYRNVIQKSLAERFSTPAAVGIASAIFALAHVPAYLGAGWVALAVSLALLFALSVVFGAVFVWTRSLVVVAAVHGLYNATLLVGLFLTVA